MRIGVNLLFLVPREGGGSETLLTNLTSALLDTGHDLVVFALRGFSATYPEIAARAEVVEAPWASPNQALRIPAEHTWLPVEVKRRRIDVLHHGVGTVPLVKVRPTVTTVHDIQYRHYPQNFAPAKRLWLRANLPVVMRWSEVITVPSAFVKTDLERAFHVAADRVMVVPFGSERLFGDSPAEADEVRHRYRLDRPFFLFPARAYPHKNHRFLIRAYAPLADEADLVLTGAAWPHDAAVAAEAERLGLPRRVRRLGLVPRGDLAGLYRAALAFTFPSRFEGFGAPALEAMSLGCAVIASNAASLPEVVGEAGILLDPTDEDAWTKAMSHMLTRPDLREALAQRGRERAARFSWRRAADLQAAAYARALDRG
jgi:alpha-1,3-rhamnosyl/mannosyltransferase